MKKPSAASTIASVLSVLALSACGSGAPEVDTTTPEGQAYVFRESVMTILAAKMTTIGGMAREEIPLDEAVFTKSVNDLAAVSGMLPEGFMPEGMPPGSRALPEIWSNWADFQQKAADLQNAAQGLADAVETGGFAAAQGLVQSTAGTCGGCHRTYRAPDEEE